ncbi:TonB-dependent receptor [Kineobactrum salinum]|uniref:TonB-dependent receptor n=1 Tax=Kineobactrum salinum TaxID=2708301 RepID=A0A6C0U2B5_9GAMM|nr:TonB-dependent receptor [Kineobactrum salinum]QIB66068.1 TonB-dependent receptor [Kineobactrum salinum]
MPAKNRTRYLGSLIAAVALGNSVQSDAQEQAHSTAAYTLEEVTVTARKREESLQDAPVSVTAFTNSTLEARSLFNLGNLSAVTPNVDISHGKGDGGSTNAAVYIRGVGQNDFIFPTDPGVGIYVDGVYIARSIGGMMDLSDIERVEVLRGPQGTLYGKNTIGGAINVVTTRPGNETEGTLRVTAGSRDRLDLEGSISVPLIPRHLFGKVAVASKNQDGYSRRLLDGTDMGDTNLDTLRAGVSWLASDDVDVYLAYDVTRIRQNGAPGTLLETFDDPSGLYAIYNALAAPLATGPGLEPGSQFDNRWVTDSPYRSNGTGPTRDHNDTWGLTATVDWQLGSTLNLKAITGYREMDAEIQVDMDYSPFPIVQTDEQQEQTQFSQELQISGLAVDGRLQWLAGAYYFEEDITDNNTTFLASGIYDALEMLPGAFVPLVPDLPCPAAFPAPCAGGQGNPYNVMFDLDVNPLTGLETENWAAFANLSWALTERAGVTLGGRYSYEKKTYDIDSIFPNSGNVATPPTTDSQSWSQFTPKLGLDYRLDEDALLYFSWEQGFKSGGWNPRPLSPLEFKRYDQEELTAYEVGLKSRLFDNRMTLNLAAFFSEYEDLQLTSNSVNPDNGSLLLTVDNAGDVDIWGLELELVARPLEAVDINLGVGYMDNEYSSLSPATGYSIDNKLPQAPKWTANAGAQYRLGLGQYGSLTLRGDVTFRSRVYNDSFNTPEIVQSSYTLLNARLTWQSAAGSWRVALFGTNLTDEEYFTSAESVPSFGFRNAVYGRPSEWGVSITREF